MKSVKLGLPAKFIKLSAQTNFLVLNFLIKKILSNLKKIKVSNNKAKKFNFGLSHKKNLDDIRESASIKLIDKLHKKILKILVL